MEILPVVMGLDVGRYHWSSLGLWAAILGIVLFSLGWIDFDLGHADQSALRSDGPHPDRP